MLAAIVDSHENHPSSSADDTPRAQGRLEPLDLQTAYAHHQAGRNADAARIYHALLQRNPDDPAVLHLFGVLHQQCGHSARAVQLIERAIALRPDVAAFHANLAEAQRSLGQHEQAAASCRAALALRPAYPEALNNLGLALHELGQNEEAVAQYDAALALQPDFAMAQNNRGSALRALGKTAEAVEAYRAAVTLDPTLARAHANLGPLLADGGQLVEALGHCREAVRYQPGLAAAHNNLGNVLRAMERWVEAGDAYAEAIRLEPDLNVAHANRGLALQRQGKFAEALPHFRRAAEMGGGDAAALGQLAAAHGIAEDWTAAVLAAERRALLTPQEADAHAELGWAYQSDGRPAPAEAAYRRALELAPDHLDALLNLGSLHEELGAMAEAETCYRQAEDRHPQSPLPLARRGVLARGRLSEAERDRLRFSLYQPCGPGPRMNLLYALAHVADGRGDHAEAAACLEPANALARELRRGRGQTYDADEHSRYVDRLIAAFTPELFERLAGAGTSSRVRQNAGETGAVALSRSRVRQNAGETRVLANAATGERGGGGDDSTRPETRVLANAATGERGGGGDDSTRPVFVLGLPRSGTTLVEQVLASHSQVFGAGELPLMYRAMDALPAVVGRICNPSSGSKPEEVQRRMENPSHGSEEGRIENPSHEKDMAACLAALDAATLRRLAQGYQDGVEQLLAGPTARESRPTRVVDKMPDNYLYLGLIAVLFPRATVIHVRRDVRDVAVSCWMTHFRAIRWADDQGDLARRIGDYQRLAAHWQAVLPQRIHEVCYERLVDDFESEARRLVAACGLEWEPACLRFHETSRPVRTASVTQVRQPLYRKSVARWKAYEPFLGPLFERLQENA